MAIVRVVSSGFNLPTLGDINVEKGFYFTRDRRRLPPIGNIWKPPVPPFPPINQAPHIAAGLRSTLPPWKEKFFRHTRPAHFNNWINNLDVPAPDYGLILNNEFIKINMSITVPSSEPAAIREQLSKVMANGEGDGGLVHFFAGHNYNPNFIIPNPFHGSGKKHDIHYGNFTLHPRLDAGGNPLPDFDHGQRIQLMPSPGKPLPPQAVFPNLVGSLPSYNDLPFCGFGWSINYCGARCNNADPTRPCPDCIAPAHPVRGRPNCKQPTLCGNCHEHFPHTDPKPVAACAGLPVTPGCGRAVKEIKTINGRQVVKVGNIEIKFGMHLCNDDVGPNIDYDRRIMVVLNFHVNLDAAARNNLANQVRNKTKIMLNHLTVNNTAADPLALHLLTAQRLYPTDVPYAGPPGGAGYIHFNIIPNGPVSSDNAPIPGLGVPPVFYAAI